MKIIKSTDEMKAFGARMGASLRGGEVIELIGDLGAGKTTFAKGLGEGMAVEDDILSPSFTISREYPARDGLELHHYDLYRLQDPGVVRYELAESVTNPQAVTVIEWAETAHDVLPDERLTLNFGHVADGESRECHATIPERYSYLGEVCA